MQYNAQHLEWINSKTANYKQQNNTTKQFSLNTTEVESSFCNREFIIKQ